MLVIDVYQIQTRWSQGQNNNIYDDLANQEENTESCLALYILFIGLKLVGEPKLCIIAFTSTQFHIYQLADEMKVPNWAVYQGMSTRKFGKQMDMQRHLLYPYRLAESLRTICLYGKTRYARCLQLKIVFTLVVSVYLGLYP